MVVMNTTRETKKFIKLWITSKDVVMMNTTRETKKVNKLCTISSYMYIYPNKPALM